MHVPQGEIVALVGDLGKSDIELISIFESMTSSTLVVVLEFETGATVHEETASFDIANSPNRPGRRLLVSSVAVEDDGCDWCESNSTGVL